MTRRLAVVLVLSFTLALGACASSPEGARSGSQASAASRAGQPPTGSPLAKVALNMNDAQVRKLLGDPTSSNAYMTGKAWIPFYFGSDTHRSDWMYEGMGRVVFSRNRWTAGLKVVRVIYEPTETAGR